MPMMLRSIQCMMDPWRGIILSLPDARLCGEPQSIQVGVLHYEPEADGLAGKPLEVARGERHGALDVVADQLLAIRKREAGDGRPALVLDLDPDAARRRRREVQEQFRPLKTERR